jgi:hypothetical protein
MSVHYELHMRCLDSFKKRAKPFLILIPAPIVLRRFATCHSLDRDVCLKQHSEQDDQ